jgi:hypothetical protein
MLAKIKAEDVKEGYSAGKKITNNDPVIFLKSGINAWLF